MKRSLTVAVSALLSSCAALNASGSKQCFHLHDFETGVGYCQAIQVGRTLHVSGSVGEGPMPDAIKVAYNELKLTLQARGFTFHDVIRENVYTTNLDDFIANKSVRTAYYGSDFPAATWVQVQRLYEPSFVVEVELTAQMK